MAEVKTPGTRAADIEAAAAAASDFDLRPELGELGSYTRARLEGPQPKSLKSLVAALSKGWLVFLVCTMASGILSLSYVIIHQWAKTDERQDVGIEANRREISKFDTEFEQWKSKVNYFIVIAERSDRKLDDMREETLREYRKQAVERGDEETRTRLTKKLDAIEKAKSVVAPLATPATPPPPTPNPTPTTPAAPPNGGRR